MLGKALSLAAAGNAGGEIDPDFNDVVMLVHADGTDGGQNNTFLDSSSNEFPIIRQPTNGPNSVTQGSFSPYLYTYGWSLYINNTRTTWPAVCFSGLSGSTFTAEYWYRPFANGGIYGGMILGINKPGRTDSVFLYHASNGTVGITTAGSTIFTSFGTTQALPLNRWTHVAITVEGSSGTAVGKIYLNGELVKTQTNMNTGIPDLGVGSMTGTRGDGSQYALYGNLHSLRIIKNQVLYTGNFIPPLGPLTADSVGTFGDNVASSITGTVHFLSYRDSTIINLGTTGASTGNASILEENYPIRIGGEYFPEIHSGSGYFDGVSTYLAVNDGAAYEFGVANFCVETWFNIPNTSGNKPIFAYRYDTNSEYGFTLSINGNRLSLAMAYSTGGPWVIAQDITAFIVPTNRFNHVAVVRNNSEIAVYFNGVKSVVSSSYTGAVAIRTIAPNDTYIGINGLSGNYVSRFVGWMSDFRVTVGEPVYTESFSAPTTRLTAGANTKLLLNFANAPIFDSSAKHNIETVSTARINGTIKKFGTGSMEFNGTSDNLIVPYSSEFSFGTGPFTVEGWFYFRDLSTTARGLIIFGDGANGSGPIYNAWSLQYLGSEGSNQLNWQRYDGTVYGYVTSGATIIQNTWHHIAISRSSTGTLRIFLDGIAYYNNNVATNFSAINTNPLRIGLAYYGPQSGYTGPRYWNGLIDDLRITNNVGRYENNFSPPDKQFPNIGE